MIEETRTEEESVAIAFDAASVRDQRRARVDALRHVPRNALEVLLRHERPHVDVRAHAVADVNRAHSLAHERHEAVRGVADGDEHRDCHASLARRAERRVHRRIGGELEIGVGKDDHVVLRAA